MLVAYNSINVQSLIRIFYNGFGQGSSNQILEYCQVIYLNDSSHGIVFTCGHFYRELYITKRHFNVGLHDMGKKSDKNDGHTLY